MINKILTALKNFFKPEPKAVVHNLFYRELCNNIVTIDEINEYYDVTQKLDLLEYAIELRANGFTHVQVLAQLNKMCKKND